MAKSRETIDASVRAYAAEKRQSLDAHPEADELAAYHRGGLDEGRRESIRDHLALCGDCTRLVLDLASFSELEPPSEEYRLTDDDVADLRAKVGARLDDGEPRAPGKLLDFTPRTAPPEPEEAPRQVRAIPWWYHTVAAALLVAVVGLSLQVMELRRSVGGVPAGNLPSRDNYRPISLVPSDEDLRGGVQGQSACAASGGGLFVILTYLEKTTYSTYRVDISDDQGQLLSTIEDRRLLDDLVTLIFPAEHQKPGEYRLKLYGSSGGEFEPLADYDLTLLDDDASP